VQQSFTEYRQLLQEHQIPVIGVANCPPSLQVRSCWMSRAIVPMLAS
jgi:hypothetical protein